jgi:hypothetical protein
MRRIGVLIEFDETDPEAKAYPSGLTRGLAQLGWTDGRNVRIDIRWPHLGASREVGSWHCQIPSWPSIVRQLSRWQSETKYRRRVFCRRPSDGAANQSAPLERRCSAARMDLQGSTKVGAGLDRRF